MLLYSWLLVNILLWILVGFNVIIFMAIGEYSVVDIGGF